MRIKEIKLVQVERDPRDFSVVTRNGSIVISIGQSEVVVQATEAETCELTSLLLREALTRAGVYVEEDQVERLFWRNVFTALRKLADDCDE